MENNKTLLTILALYVKLLPVSWASVCYWTKTAGGYLQFLITLLGTQEKALVVIGDPIGSANGCSRVCPYWNRAAQIAGALFFCVSAADKQHYCCQQNELHFCNAMCNERFGEPCYMLIICLRLFNIFICCNLDVQIGNLRYLRF